MGTRPWSGLQKDEARDLEAELERVGWENKELRATLHAMRNNYNALQAHAERVKREIAGGTESSSSHGSPKGREAELPRPKTSRVLVRTEANDTSLIVKDGFQWRKYGQKVTKDNPSPRAYYRCARAPECPVKKKVQRCAADQLVLVATYEGEHNHDPPGASSDGSNPLNGSLVGPDARTPASPLSVNPSKPAVTVELTLSGGTNPERTRAVPNIPRSASNKRKKNFEGGYRSNSSSSGDGGSRGTKRDGNGNGSATAAHGGSNRDLEEYMSSLMRDPDFRTALVGAVASSILRVRPAGG